MVDPRKQREKDFHNKTFADHTRDNISKFYTVVESSWRCYEDILRSSCSGRKTLEYGCGPGSYAFFLSEKGAVVTGIDISETAIRQARERSRRRPFSSGEFLVMDAEKLGFADNTFDLICGRAILHHLDVKGSLSELGRVLKEGGTAVFVEPLGHNPAINLYRKLTPHLRTPDEHPLLTSDLRTASEYFRHVRIQYFHCLSLVTVPLRSFRTHRLLLRFMDRIDQFIFRWLPFTRKYAWTVVIEMAGPRKSWSNEPVVPALLGERS